MKTTLVNAGPSHTSIAVWASFAQAPDNRPLAWLSALLSPNSYTVFEWQAAYDFVWAETGKLVSGKTVSAAQHLPATSVAGMAMLEKHGNGFMLAPFAAPTPPPAGTLLIQTSSDVPADQLTIGINIRIASGIGQPGNGTAVVQAQPNIAYRWTTEETYFASAGQFSQSEYDPPDFTIRPPLALDFSSGPEAVVLLDSANLLHQLGNSDLQGLMRLNDFVEVPAVSEAC